MNFANPLSAMYALDSGRSRSICAENKTGAKGQGGKAASNLGPSRKGSPCITLLPNQENVLAEIHSAGIINHIWITLPDRTNDADCFILRDLILKMYWDGEETPSVESPIGDFFCLGFGTTYQVNSQLVVVNPNRGMNCYFQMPFRKSAKIVIESQHPRNVNACYFQIDYCEYDSLPEDIGYFHAKFNREKITTLKKDYTIIDNIKGKGQYIGTFMSIATLERYWWGEGEMKFYLDGDREYPTICGTGTEDYFGGAFSFARYENGKTIETNYNSLYLGYPYYSNHDDMVTNQYHNDDSVPMRCFYRWHVLDPIKFHEDLRLTVQQIGAGHKGLFERQDDYSSVAYWYQSEPHNKFDALPCREDRIPR